MFSSLRYLSSWLNCFPTATEIYLCFRLKIFWFWVGKYYYYLSSEGCWCLVGGGSSGGRVSGSDCCVGSGNGVRRLLGRIGWGIIIWGRSLGFGASGVTISNRLRVAVGAFLWFWSGGEHADEFWVWVRGFWFIVFSVLRGGGGLRVEGRARDGDVGCELLFFLSYSSDVKIIFSAAYITSY